ncbi:uncharacterized protein LDX57_008943 [Aspergillus melleus]|uniref:uncharacterized protein n=1 Tax=Aspergillus melleus TaxID=138277 RepID=UPI001E8E6FAC|nr:uncharacterized protein LDX57_008943 [Aspergillus melleus]KAH8431281.1 hypothetical protein LDX57_008943 [Aspergillus melleus]
MRSSQITNALVALSVSLLAGTASASTFEARDVQLTAQQIEAIAPTSNTCDGAPNPDECATSEQAALNIAKSFETYEVTSPAEQAAVIGLMAFESGDFKYNRNHYPGVPGQGTRNMQSPAFNAQYAASLSGIADQAVSLAADPAGLLDLLLEDEAKDFGSGAWFLTSQCTPDVRTQLQSGSVDGWASFISGCVGTEASGDRQAYWQRAVEALGVQNA